MSNPMIGAAAIAFWAFLAVCVVSGLVYDLHRRRLQIEALRTALERGQQVDPQLLRQLFDPSDRNGRTLDESANAEEEVQALQPYLRLGGLITTASGIGLIVCALFAGQTWTHALYPLVGLGFLVMFVGVGLLVAARMLRRERASANGPGA